MSLTMGVQPQPWGQRFEPLPGQPSPPSPRGAVTGLALGEQDSSDIASTASGEPVRGEKAPHDASVFVGSLPSNIDHIELTRMLTEHLSEHTQVKSIKVIRDSKGGVCAFVQCEDAQAASALIHTLRTVTPKPFLGRILRFEPARAFRTLHVSYRAPSYILPGYATPLLHDSSELPTAMRIWKPQGSKFYHIAYNDEALAAESRQTEQDCATPESSLYLQPLTFDESSIRKLAAYFGSLERLETVDLEEAKDDLASQQSRYPSPHTAPRLPCMDPRCWEIKWDYRDDCVGALMALRRIPHLTVTWAHQPHSSGSDFYYPPRVNHILHTGQTPRLYRPSPFLPPLPFSSPAPLVSQVGSGNTSLTNSGKDTLVVGRPQGFPHQAYASSQVNMVTAASEKIVLPLPSSFKPSPTSSHVGLTLPRDVYQWSLATSNPGVSVASGFTAPPPTHPGSLLQDSHHPQQLGAAASASPLHGTPKVANRTSTYPSTPVTWIEGERQRQALIPAEVPTQRTIDPTSIFVGGLDVLGVNPWTEEGVKEYFSRYGGLESVKFVRPFEATTAFAFIKFNNTESPARAVAEEHNRVCEGRILRVQLRDCNPPRNTWKSSRGGRGRGFLQNQHRMSHRHHQLSDKFIPKRPDEHPTGLTVVSNGDRRSASPSASQEPPPSPFISDASPASDDRTLHDSKKYREWYDDLESSPNPANRPGSTTSSTSATMGPPPAYPYVFQNAPFYPGPPTWIPTPVYQGSFPVPYYPVYPAQQSDSGDSTVPVTAWTGSGMMYPGPYYHHPTCAQPQLPDPNSQTPTIAEAPNQDAGRPGSADNADNSAAVSGGTNVAALNPTPGPTAPPMCSSWAPYGHPYFHQLHSINANPYIPSMGWNQHHATRFPNIIPPVTPCPPMQPPAYAAPSHLNAPGNRDTNHHSQHDHSKRQGNRRDNFNHVQRNSGHHQRPFNSNKHFRQGMAGGGNHAFGQQEGGFAGKGKHHFMNRG
ncbi:hypothetical protein CC2G_000695 [Coprinopsis cinerea AmutBmut pab1-1]|nr:hypothetical protein CC2G_000695 [Coprinopsis cinerea AmutBmut pab1-1]